MYLKKMLQLFYTTLLVTMAGALPVQECGETGHGIVFDAGSSHTNMFIYNWPDNKTDGTGRVQEITSCDVEGGGVSDYVDEPTKAGESLEECIAVALDNIDEEDWKYTPIYLGSTAGMRLVSETDPAGSAAIFDSLRNTLSETPFNFTNPEKQARIISGENEGLFGWVTTNYISNRFTVGPITLLDYMVAMVTGAESNQKTTFGALDLGGGSTQMTFEPENPEALPDRYRLNKRFYGNSYSLYSNSFLCYGANEAIRRLKAIILRNANYSTDGVDNPCLHTGQNEILDGTFLWKAPCSEGPQAMAGWGSEVKPPANMADISYDTQFVFNGTGDSEQCATMVAELFNFTTPCEFPPCSFNGVHQPKPYGSFLAFSAFYWVVDALIGTTTPTIAEIDTARSEFCAKSLEQVMELPGYHKYYLNYCFNINYVRTLLIDGYGFDESNWNIEFVRKVNDVSVGWTMGYMIDATNRIPEEDCGSSRATPGIPMCQLYTVMSCSILLIIRDFLFH